MFKNVSLRKRNTNGQPTWVLLGPDGLPIPAFSAYAYTLRHSAKNTLESYCRHLAEFLDYLIEASSLHGGQLTKLQLSEAIESYGDYLLLGADAISAFARAVAAQSPPSQNSPASLIPKKAAIRRFLRLSEDVRKEIAELARLKGNRGIPVDGEPLMSELGTRRELQTFEVRAMQANSMLAGVIAGGPKFIDSLALTGGVVDIQYEQSRAFPYDKVLEFIDALPTGFVA